MYLEESQDPTKTVLQWATQCFQIIRTMVLRMESFWAYIEKQWMLKVDMWLIGNRHLLHAGQDTNAEIESYHRNMKAILRALKSRLVGRRID